MSSMKWQTQTTVFEKLFYVIIHTDYYATFQKLASNSPVSWIADTNLQLDIKGSGVHTETEMSNRPISGCVADLIQRGRRCSASFGLRTEAKQRSDRIVPVLSMASVSGMCWFSSSNYSHKGLSLWLLPPTSGLTPKTQRAAAASFN